MLTGRLHVLPEDLGAPALIGVSGGRDSVTLLHLLLKAGCQRLTVCHLDHGLRPESAGDAEFVSEVAARHGLPFLTERVDVGSLARTKKQSMETAAREARYAFYARAASARDCSRIFLGHHADDQVETFLFNLFRGAGTAGLRGMQAATMREVEGVSLRLLRPMLGIWRSEIDAWLHEHEIPYREDASNTDARHTRNRVRHSLLPVLEETFGRDVRAAVWRAAEILGAEDEMIAQMPALQGELSAAAELSVSVMNELPAAIQRRVIHRWLRTRGIADVGYDDIEAVRSLLAGGKPAKVNLSGNRHARRRAGKLFIQSARPEI